MTRFDDYGYDEDYNNQGALFWANCDRALTGQRGIAALRELEAALVALPEPELVLGSLARDGKVCAVGAMIVQRKIAAGQRRDEALAWLEGRGDIADETATIGENELGITYSLAYRLAYLNDEEVAWNATDAERYQAVLTFVRKRLELAA